MNILAFAFVFTFLLFAWPVLFPVSCPTTAQATLPVILPDGWKAKV